MTTLTPIRQEVGDVLRVVGWRLEDGTAVKRPTGATVMYQPQPWEPEPIVLQSPSDPEVTITLRNLGRRVPDAIQLPDDDPRVNPAWAAIRAAVEADPSLSADEPKPPPTAEEIEAARLRELAEAKAAAKYRSAKWWSDKAMDGIEIADGVFLPADSDASSKLAVRLANWPKDIPFSARDVNGRSWTASSAEELQGWVVKYQSEYFRRDALLGVVDNAIDDATTTDEVAAALALLGV